MCWPGDYLEFAVDVVAGRLPGVCHGCGGREIALSVPWMWWPADYPELAVDVVAGKLP